MSRVRETDKGGDVIRPDTVAGRTFYNGITAEREKKERYSPRGFGNRERERAAINESWRGSDACLVSSDVVQVDVSFIRSSPQP